MIEGMTLHQAVEFAIKTEELGQRVYRKLADRFADEREIAEIFATLAQDEARHEKQFRNLLPRVPPDEGISNQDARSEYLRAMSLSQFFMGKGHLFGAYEEIGDRTGALVRAFELEKATVQYYQAIEQVLGENETLGEILAAEKEHMMRLLRVLMADAKFRGLADDF
jgi:rubrerythrin